MKIEACPSRKPYLSIKHFYQMDCGADEFFRNTVCAQMQGVSFFLFSITFLFLASIGRLLEHTVPVVLKKHVSKRLHLFVEKVMVEIFFRSRSFWKLGFPTQQVQLREDDVFQVFFQRYCSRQVLYDISKFYRFSLQQKFSMVCLSARRWLHVLFSQLEFDPL